MRMFAKLSLAVFVVFAAGGVVPASAGGSYYKGVSTSPVNDGHGSQKYAPSGKTVNHPPPRNGSYYKGLSNKK
ncbi:hypothetical protein LAC81_29110 [Ensifer adhaerens]|uniref:hypothetical protein n=1 Tax=Ensifer adhaerens TaxID=106592 RepID=UPI001CBFE42C|nr:hypothetical protein [Ensifer adhaerens]MBZ7924801.1 hypothetical protein [Ensifer adhaerens]UAX95978.1 hypothetical protein LAC78_34720 [Ensifer adhaerens]UAY04680.1 hypothetical protein LAC80_25590 [Ensifer adhaerens]UAY10111.1 hypothetical protein LAC81_29110 [Ensifer adhaerens]